MRASRALPLPDGVALAKPAMFHALLVSLADRTALPVPLPDADEDTEPNNVAVLEGGSATKVLAGVDDVTGEPEGCALDDE